MAENRRWTLKERTLRGQGQVTPIDVLPDDVLLLIFDFCVSQVKNGRNEKGEIGAWQSLVHVCRRWRSIVFQSPRRLNLQLYWSPKTAALDVWPALPLIIMGRNLSLGTDNVVAALGQSDRVGQVILNLEASQSEDVLAAMQVPFPELTDLHLSSYKEAQVVPDSFLGGSAPRLRSLLLKYIPFPGLPKLLLSATRLVELVVLQITHSGYISPEAIVASLSVMPGLEELILVFESPESCPDLESRNMPPPKRSILPALREFHFEGITEYSEQVVTRIDTPQLHNMDMIFINRIDFHCPQLAQFLNRTPSLIGQLSAVRVRFYDSTVYVRLHTWFSYLVNIHIRCGEPNQQLSSVEQVFNSSYHPFSSVKKLCIDHKCPQLVWTIENTFWLELLLPFTAAKRLYLSKEFAPCIAASLQVLVGDRIMEVLPSLEDIFVEDLESSGAFRENIGQFIAARQLSNHPITISRWFKF